MQTTRITLIALAALLAGCSTGNTPVDPSDARPHFDGNHTFGSGNSVSDMSEPLLGSATDSVTTSEERGTHLIGGGG